MAGSGEAAGEARAGAEGRPRPAGLAPAASPFPCLLRARGLQDLSGDGGVRKEELRPGSGQAVPPGASVAVKYSGYLEHCDEPFCTNCYSKSPGLMKLGKDITLGGLEIGLLTMKKGEVARFVFTPYYAYGQQGCPPLIPPNATVMFEVEVLDFLDSEECDAFFELTAEQQGTFPLQKVLKVADTEREFGNYLYCKRHFEGAKDRYKRLLQELHGKGERNVLPNVCPSQLFFWLTRNKAVSISSLPWSCGPGWAAALLPLPCPAEASISRCLGAIHQHPGSWDPWSGTALG
ncbi:inactive peptidyl-prolyl cis-trans isomerase FKBP6 isoform 10-T11 [Theristicus caerulescens]